MTHHPTAILKDKSQPDQARLDALLHMVEQFDPEYFPILSVILADGEESDDIRCSVALALGKVGGEPAFKILQGFCHEDNLALRNYVIQALGMTHYEGAAPLLIEALQDKNNDIFASASQGLGELGHVAMPHLITLLSTGAEDARCIAAWQLGELQDQHAIPTLIETIRTDKSVSVLALCIWALGEIGFGSQEVLDILSDARKQEEPDVRLRAETAIKKIVRFSN